MISKLLFSHDFIGEFFATVNSLTQDYKNATTFPCINEKKRKKKGSKYKNSGVVRPDSKLLRKVFLPIKNHYVRLLYWHTMLNHYVTLLYW